MKRICSLLITILILELMPFWTPNNLVVAANKAPDAPGFLESLAKFPENTHAKLKSAEIAKYFPSTISYTAQDGNNITIEKVSAKEKHVELFVRAWKDKKQYGFGHTGSIETERLRVYNPPILVPSGTTRTVCNLHDDCYEVSNFKEDPEAALKAVVEDMVRVTGRLDSQIEKGSIGRTVDIYYPSLNGIAFRFISGGSEDFTSMRSGAGNDHDDTADEEESVGLSAASGSNLYHYNIRMFYIFDTSSVGGTEEISDATFSAYGTYRNSGLGGAVNIVGARPASDYAVVNSDYDIGNFGSTAYASSVNFSSINNAGYQDFTLNSSGIAAIDKNSNTYLGLLTSFDFNNSEPTWCENCYSDWGTKWISTGGTTQDPKLTVTHTGLPDRPPTSIQNISYEYDANGNITKITDTSDTNTAKTTDFTYDDLNRLLTASTTNATSGSNYAQSYTYDAIGNILSSTPGGSYTYNGAANGNPHAATNIGGVTYTYDKSGNLTSDSVWTHTWDYRNRLTKSVATSTLKYWYDHTNTRTRFSVGASTTLITSPYYSLENSGSSTVKYILGAGMLLATLRGTGASTTPYYIHPDHLGSSEKTTDASGDIVELSDYYPFGSLRQNTQNGINDRKGYIGKDFDADTGLSQFEARYYNSSVGRFISQDPMFWSQQNLIDPQSLNSYSYANNNPITSKDPTGRQAEGALSGFSWTWPSMGAVAAAGPYALLGGGALIMTGVIGVPWVLAGPDARINQTTQRVPWQEIEQVSSPPFEWQIGEQIPTDPQLPKNKPPGGKWKGIGLGLIIGIGGAVAAYNSFQDHTEGVQGVKTQMNTVFIHQSNAVLSAGQNLMQVYNQVRGSLTPQQQATIGTQINHLQQQLNDLQRQVNEMQYGTISTQSSSQ